MVVLDIGDRRILEVLLSTENCLCSIRMVREKHAVESLESLSEIPCEGHVLLLIDSLKLSMETTDDRVHEPVSLHAGPVLDLV